MGIGSYFWYDRRVEHGKRNASTMVGRPKEGGDGKGIFQHGAFMKKGVVGLVVVLALVAAGMPFANGMLMERGIRGLVEDINTRYAESGTDMKVEIASYDRGFSSSDIEWKVNLGSLKSVYGVDDVVLVEHAEHGYKGVISSTSLERNKWFTDFVNSRLGGKNPLAITTEYSLISGIRSLVSLQPLTLQTEEGAVASKGAELAFESDWKLKQLRGSGSLEGLAVPGKIEMERATFTYELKMISTFIWDGTMSMQVGKVTVQEGAKKMEMTGLQAGYNMDYDEAKRTLATEVTYGIGTLFDGTEQIKNGSATIGIKGVDAAAYEEAIKAYTTMAQEMLKQVTAAGDDQNAAMAAMQEKMNTISMQMVPLAEKFLKDGLEISVKDLHAGLPQGEVRGNILLRLEKDLTVAQMMPMMQSPQQILEFFTLQADFQLPAELVGDNPMLLEPVSPAMQTGLFVKEGTNLVSKAETKDKKLFLNGQQIVLE